MTTSFDRVSVVGLGKLGSPIAAALAHRGFTVVGVDTDGSKVDAINRGEPTVFEPGFPELLGRTGGRLCATTDTAAAIRVTDATMVIVPTPSHPAGSGDAAGSFSLKFMLPVCQTIGQALRKKDAYHVVVITSTVMPGHTDGPIRETLELYSGKKAGRDFGLCYSPEFVALGSVIRDFLHPDLVLIGQCDDRAGAALESIALRAAVTRPGVARMNPVNAELAKLAVNTYVTTKITYANMLASICGRLPGADVDVVTQAIGLDSRIGRKYLKGAIGYGGPCFPRDNVAMSALARSIGAQADLAEAVDAANRRGVERLASLVRSQIEPGDTVAVLGMAYKPDTDVVEQSQGLQLAAALADGEMSVIVHDPAAMPMARRVLHGSVRYATDLADAVRAADAVVVATAWPEYVGMDPAVLARPQRRRVVIDCWRCLDAGAVEAHADLVAVGVGTRSAAVPSLTRRVA